MTVRIYKSTDASAPVLTGQTGSLVALLDAILVNGYGAITAAGWTKAFSATNKAAYRQNATGANNTANPMYIYVDDTGPGAGSSREARVCGFETMSAITPTGTGQFPTSGQSGTTVTGGYLVCRKSATADATARQWTCIANGQTFYLFIESGDVAVPLACTTMSFGDFKSFKVNDLYAVFIMARTTENQAGGNYDSMGATSHGQTNGNINTLNAGLPGHYIARHWTGVGGSVKWGKPVDWSRFLSWGSQGGMWGNYSNDTQTQFAPVNGPNSALGRYHVGVSTPLWPAPNGPDGSLALAPVWVGHSNALRGYLPGLWCPMHDRPLNHLDAFTVVGGNMNGKSLIGLNIQAYINGAPLAENGQVIVEYSDTWS
jgi:hypothetical protein